jgi:ABC-2 type transport system permease protein
MTSSLGLGIFASTIARTSQQVLFIIFFIMVFFMLLSGFFLPIENMPDWVQKITYINPVRYFMFIVREIFLKGAGFAELWRESLYMLSIGALFFGLSLLFFTKKTA